MRRVRRVSLVIGIAGLSLLLIPAAAWAAPGGSGHTVSDTQVTHGAFDPEIDGPNPCSGALITSATATGNTVFHETFFPSSDEYWVTGTEAGKVTIVDANHVTYTGQFTTWFGSNWNRQNQNNTFTLTVVLRGTDGTTIRFQEVQHFAVNANGDVTVDFDTPRLTCGGFA